MSNNKFTISTPEPISSIHGKVQIIYKNETKMILFKNIPEILKQIQDKITGYIVNCESEQYKAQWSMDYEKQPTYGALYEIYRDLKGRLGFNE